MKRLRIVTLRKSDDLLSRERVRAQRHGAADFEILKSVGHAFSFTWRQILKTENTVAQNARRTGVGEKN